MPEKVLERNRKSRRSMKLGARRDEWTKLDTSLRLFIYRHVIAKCRAPSIAEMAKRFKSRKQVDAVLQRLCASHAFVLQENGELWRAAPFSAVPTAFPVRIGRRSWYANCIWDALGIPAMLAQNARIDASCGCCNLEMLLTVENGRLLGPNDCLHVKNHASVPVGAACESLVQTVESASGWRPGLAARLAPGEGMVQRSAKSCLAAKKRIGGGGRLRTDWTQRGVLETVGLKRTHVT